MEKITIYFRSGDVKEYTGKLTSTSLTGNNLMVTEKETTKTEEGDLLVTTTKLYSLDTIDRIVKITPTKTFEYTYASDK